MFACFSRFGIAAVSVFLVLTFGWLSNAQDSKNTKPSQTQNPKFDLDFGMISRVHSYLVMIRTPEVQKELGLTLREQAEVEKIQRENYEKNRAAGRELKKARENLAPDQKKMTKAEELKSIFQAARKVSEESDNQVAKLLGPDRLRRLQEIQVQDAGFSAFFLDRVESQIAMTDNQIAKFRIIYRDLLVAMRDADSKFSKRPEKIKRFDELHRDAETKVLAVLTNEQKQTLDQIKGKPFDITSMTISISINSSLARGKNP